MRQKNTVWQYCLPGRSMAAGERDRHLTAGLFAHKKTDMCPCIRPLFPFDPLVIDESGSDAETNAGNDR